MWSPAPTMVEEARPPPPQPRTRRTGRFKGRRTSGGGAARAFFSKHLKGRKFHSRNERKLIFKELSERYRSIKRQGGAAWAGHAEQGAAVVASHAQVGHSFQAPPRKQRQGTIIQQVQAVSSFPSVFCTSARSEGVRLEAALAQQEATEAVRAQV